MAIGSSFGRVRAITSDWMVPAGLIALGLIPAIAGSVRLADVATATNVTADNARFLASPLPVVLHVLAAIPHNLLVAEWAIHRGHRAPARVAATAVCFAS